MRPIRSEFVLPPPTVVGELGPTGGTLAAKAASGVLAARSVRRRLTLVAARQCGRLVAAACTLRVPPVPAPAILPRCPARGSMQAADHSLREWRKYLRYLRPPPAGGAGLGPP
jgi:hypothetical protein